MRLRSFTLHDIGPFLHASLDLDAIPGTVIALHGPNWSGKTTALEAGFAGAISRETPTRGSLKDLARSRGSYVESVVDSFRIKQLVDSHTGTAKALVKNAVTGAVLLESGGARDYDRWAKEHLPAQDLFLAAVFGAQGSAGFLGMSAADRKAILLRALGIEKLERLAERAAEKAKSARIEVDTLAARLRDEKARSLPLERAEAELSQATGALAAAAQATADAQRQLDEARTQAAARLAAAERRAAHAAAVADLENRRADVEEQRDAAVLRIREAQNLLHTAQATKATAEQVDDLRARLVAAEASLATKRTEREEAHRVVLSAQQARAVAEQTAKRAGEDVRRAEEAIRRAAVAEEALRALPKLREERDEKVAARETARATEQQLQAIVLRGKDQRISLLRDGLQMAGASADDVGSDAEATLRLVRQTQRECLADDDDLAKKHAAAPAALRAAKHALDAAEREATVAESHVVRAENAAGLKEALDAAIADRTRAAAEKVAAELSADEHEETWHTSHERWTAIDREVSRLGKDVDGVRAALTKAEEATKKLHDLARAEAERRVAEEQVTTLDATLADLGERIAALGPAPSCPPPVDVAAAERGASVAWTLEHQATRAHALAEAALQTATASAERARAIEAELQVAEQLHADWLLIAKGYGRDGVQALEIDAAGPELTALINDLLYSSFGTRFCVEIRTTRPKADKSGDREVCDVIVTEEGVEKEGYYLSGAGKVVVGLAIRRALAVLSCRRLGLSDPLFVEDETDAALSDENAVAFITMLRRTAEITGGRVVFVSHKDVSLRLADTRVLVRDGRIEVEGNGEEAQFEEAAIAA